MANDRTLQDLAEATSESSESGGGGGESTGKWVNELVDNLDNRGLLRPLLFGVDGDERNMSEIQADGRGTMDAEPDHAEHVEHVDADHAGAGGGGSGPRGDRADHADLDSEQLKGLMLQIYDNTSMIPGMDDDPRLSDLIKFVDSNPELVDQLAEQYL